MPRPLIFPIGSQETANQPKAGQQQSVHGVETMRPVEYRPSEQGGDEGQDEFIDENEGGSNYNDSRFDRLEEIVSQNSQLASALAIPEVRQAMDAVGRGQKVHVLTDEQLEAFRQTVKPKEEQAEEPNWEELSQKPQDMVKALRKQIVGEVLSSFTKTLTGQLQPVVDAVKDLQETKQEFKAKTVQGELEAAIQQYPDLPKYGKVMAQLREQNPGLDVEELYHLARKRVGKIPMERNRRTESERPTNNSSRPASREEPQGPVVGRNSFQDALTRAMKKINITNGFDDDRV